MYQFKDFAPEIKRKGLFKLDTQTMESTLAIANAWIERNQINVVNIETVVLPEMWSEEGTTDVHLTTSGDMMSSWYQFIRIWYKTQG